MSDLVKMARAAQHDDRLADGALYGKLADRIEALENALREIAQLSAGVTSTKFDALIVLIARTALAEGTG